MWAVNAESCGYCFIDLDFDNCRNKLATAAAFVDATDSRYGFSSKDLRSLGGSEISRIPESIATDHEWASRNTECGGIETRPHPAGNRIVVKLYWDVAPIACENFATLCANGSVLPGTKEKAKPAPIGESGKPLTYRGSTIHRVIPGFVIQGGDFVMGNGSAGESIYNGKKFKDERAGLLLKHLQKGVLSMGNSGKVCLT
jgi:cyclophilin family peptidyl-prolyl cis-trans isomerase